MRERLVHWATVQVSSEHLLTLPPRHALCASAHLDPGALRAHSLTFFPRRLLFLSFNFSFYLFYNLTPGVCVGCLFFFGGHAGFPRLLARPGAGSPVPEAMRTLPAGIGASRKVEGATSYGEGERTRAAQGEGEAAGPEFKLDARGQRISC